ncbi:MAG TPA: hypothetical protein VGW77_34715 [Candidatus Binatia bacterium]|nr:hypothetical protein [Candidatus Binatia bacterium]
MSDAQDHSDHVNKWMTQTAQDLSSDQLLELFEEVTQALWSRAHLTLGVVTLTAVMDRVLYNASERFSPFESLKVVPGGIDCQELRDRGEVLDGGDLREAMRFVVVEFLVVIGNLTGELLTPALHSELSKITPKDSVFGSKHEEGTS